MKSVELLKEIYNGDVYDFVSYMRKDRIETEFAELLYTWSVFESDPVKLQGAMLRHIKRICENVADDMTLPNDDFESRWLDACDRNHDERKDREAERG